MIIKQHKLCVPKLEDFADINDFLKACSLYNELIEKRTEMKGYTDLEQSKKLAEVLPLESADMTWKQVDPITGDLAWEPLLGLNVAIKDNLFSYRNGYTIPCWSLAALLEQIPEKLFDDNGFSYELEIIKQKGLCYINYLCNDYDGIRYHSISSGCMDTLVDACVDVLFKLHKQKLF